MDKYEVALYPKAIQDIEEIYKYISLIKQSPESAKNQSDRIWNQLKKLELFPKAHQDRLLVGRYAKKGYKQLLIDHYIAIYKIDKNAKKVYIVTIQYQGRNL